MPARIAPASRRLPARGWPRSMPKWPNLPPPAPCCRVCSPNAPAARRAPARSSPPSPATAVTDGSAAGRIKLPGQGDGRENAEQQHQFQRQAGAQAGGSARLPVGISRHQPRAVTPRQRQRAGKQQQLGSDQPGPWRANKLWPPRLAGQAARTRTQSGQFKQ